MHNLKFPEMQGNIIYVDYERSAWRYMNYERSHQKEELDAFKIGGALPVVCDTIEPYLIGGTYKGGGSAYGGKWKPNPNKPQDMLFKGEPNTTRREFLPQKRGGYWAVAKYNDRGNAIIVRHETEHAPGSGHSNPHDHVYSWNSPDEHPQKEHTINYWDGNIPELKSFYGGNIAMSMLGWDELYRFHTISEFKTSMRWGAEVVIEWNGKEYGIWSEGGIIRITCSDGTHQEQRFTSSDDALEYMVGNDRLRDVITQVTVLDRTI